MAPHFERASKKQQDDAGKKDPVLLQEGSDHGWQHAGSVILYVVGTLVAIMLVSILFRFWKKGNLKEASEPWKAAFGLEGGAASTTSMLSDLTRLSQL
jgi:hypothetical protein